MEFETRMDVPAQLPWQSPTVESHGSLEQLTKSVNNAGNGDGVFSDANS